MVDLGVRYFGGNPVFACFFDEDNFVQRDYEVPERDLKAVLDEVGKIMIDIKWFIKKWVIKYWIRISNQINFFNSSCVKPV